MWDHLICILTTSQQIISFDEKILLKVWTCFFLRQIAIKEIILDPNKKNRTKEAVLKEARYIHLCKLFYQLIITIIINLLLWLSLLSSASSLIISKRCSTITLSLSTELWGRPDKLCKGKGQGVTLQWTDILSRESSNAPVVLASCHRNWDFVEQIMLSFHVGFVHIRNVQHQIFSLKAAIKKLLKLLSFLSNFVQASIQFLCGNWIKIEISDVQNYINGAISPYHYPR